jgi:phosphoribosyl 1,2-cyclic phosphate phosphodiesterase
LTYYLLTYPAGRSPRLPAFFSEFNFSISCFSVYNGILELFLTDFLNMQAKFLFLGTGTSIGTPMIGCSCKVCKSENSRNKRLRCSSVIMLENGLNILIDASTDLRQQALRYNINRLDAVLLTHHHADHIFGLDDLRVYNYLQNRSIQVYTPKKSLAEIKKVYSYAFSIQSSKGGFPRMELIPVWSEPFDVKGINIVPVPVNHGEIKILGYRIGNLAYLTDVSAIPEKSLRLLRGLSTLVLSALRYKPHPKHLSVDQAVEMATRIGADRTYFTHISHWVEHNEMEEAMPEGI